MFTLIGPIRAEQSDESAAFVDQVSQIKYFPKHVMRHPGYLDWAVHPQAGIPKILQRDREGSEGTQTGSRWR